MGKERSPRKIDEVPRTNINVADIEKAITQSVRRRRIHLSSGIIYVTDLVQCLRKTYFEATSFYTKTKLMAIGEHLHTDVIPTAATLLQIDGYRTEYEASVSKPVRTACMEIEVRGRIDILVNGIPIELKFSNTIYDHHVLQAEYYAWMLGVDRYVICIVSDRGDVKCSMISRHIPDEYLFHRIETLACALLEHNPPKPEKGVWCSHCPFKSMCIASRKLSDYVL